MQVEIRHSPAFAVARITLAANETVRAKSGAMMATSSGISVEAKMEGGLMKGLKRSVLGGESLFITRFIAGGEGGWVDAAGHLPGDTVVIDVNGALNISRSNWICSSDGVEIDTKWGGFKNLVGGEGGFLVRATGQGQTVLSVYGAVDRVDLAAGETMVLDSAHMVAFSDDLTYTTRKVTSGIMQTLKSGEGLVFELAGPGTVWTQSRNTQELIAWLTVELPFTTE
jgi:uncharacterized protein (TIGR00266 family)